MIDSCFYVYILYSNILDRFYVGSTNDLAGRVERHNSSKYGYTKHGRPWELVYQEEYQDRGSALKREKLIKSWRSSKAIRRLIVK